MLRSNRWRYFLLLFICKVAETYTNEVSDSIQQGFNINNDYELDYTFQDNGRAFKINDITVQDEERAFQVNEDYENNSRRIDPTPRKYKNCPKCGMANLRRSRRRIENNNADPIRVLGGKKVKPKRKYPWQVGISEVGYKFEMFFCSGSIINDRWILSASHCFHDYNAEWNACPEYENVKYTVRVGEHKQSTKKDNDPDNTIDYEVVDVIFHPKNEKECPKWSDYDFALLKLKDNIPFNDVIRPVCLPEYDRDTYAGDRGIVSGWGQTSKHHFSDVLREFKFRITPNSECVLGGLDIKDTYICAAPSGNKGQCFGDSGGPLVVEKRGEYIQIGVVSFGPNADECSTLGSNVSARVSKVLDWIKKVTAEGKC